MNDSGLITSGPVGVLVAGISVAFVPSGVWNFAGTVNSAAARERERHVAVGIRRVRPRFRHWRSGAVLVGPLRHRETAHAGQLQRAERGGGRQRDPRSWPGWPACRKSGTRRSAAGRFGPGRPRWRAAAFLPLRPRYVIFQEQHLRAVSRHHSAKLLTGRERNRRSAVGMYRVCARLHRDRLRGLPQSSHSGLPPPGCLSSSLQRSRSPLCNSTRPERKENSISKHWRCKFPKGTHGCRRSVFVPRAARQIRLRRSGARTGCVCTRGRAARYRTTSTAV